MTPGRAKFQDAQAFRECGSSEVSVCSSAVLAGVGQVLQHRPLERGRGGQHREGLRGMGRDDYSVVRRHLAVAVGDLDAGRGVQHRGDLGAEADLVQLGGDASDVLVRAAAHRAPLRRAEDAEHAVVLQEREQVAGRVVQRDRRIAGPYGGHERLHEVAHEVRREPAVVEELPKCHVGRADRPRDLALREPVEARDLGEHPEVARLPQVGGGREQATPPERTSPLQAAVVVADRHRHLGGLGRHSELREQAQQHGVGARVVHDEAGVDGQPVHEVSVGMTPEPVVGLEERDLRGAGGDVRRGESGDAGTHDGDPRRRCLRVHQVGMEKSATGSDVGSWGEVPSGSTVIPTACAPRASPTSNLGGIGLHGHHSGGDHVGPALVPELVDAAGGWRSHPLGDDDRLVHLPGDHHGRLRAILELLHDPLRLVVAQDLLGDGVLGAL